MALRTALPNLTLGLAGLRVCQSTRVSSKHPSIFPAHLSAKKHAQICRVRWYSQSISSSKLYGYQDVKSMAESPSKDRVLIDVREPTEYKAGFIPSAINIPIASQPDALFLPDDEFEERLGFPKPPKDKEMIFYCKAGVRSTSAAGFALQSGYKKVGEYQGSWLDWIRQGREQR